MAEERPIVVSSHVPEEDRMPGSVELPCGGCRGLVTVSPSSLNLVIKGARVRCMACAAPTLLDASADLRVVPGQFEEIEAAKGPEARQRVEEFHARLAAVLRRRP